MQKDTQPSQACSEGYASSLLPYVTGPFLYINGVSTRLYYTSGARQITSRETPLGDLSQLHSQKRPEVPEMPCELVRARHTKGCSIYCLTAARPLRRYPRGLLEVSEIYS